MVGSSSSRSSSRRKSSSSDSELEKYIAIAIFAIGIIFLYVKRDEINGTAKSETKYKMPRQMKSSKQIENEIKTHDKLFNKEEIIAWSKTLFVKLQQAWTRRDWAEIRPFETEKLFEQHKSQLQGYINNNQINVMDRICVLNADLFDYRVSGDKEILTIKLTSRMQDYIIDATTKKVLRGDPKIERTNSYLLTFERKYGIQTKPGTMELNTTNCPNCGAPTQITSSGECEYCGSVITIGEYNWCLANLERATY